MGRIGCRLVVRILLLTLVVLSFGSTSVVRAAKPAAQDDEYHELSMNWQLQNYAKLVPRLEAYLQRHPGSPHTLEMWGWLAEGYWHLHQFQQAAPYYKKWLSKAPESDADYYQRSHHYGDVEYQLGNWSEASAAYKKASDVALTNFDAGTSLLWLSQSQYEAGDYAGALDTCNQLLIDKYANLKPPGIVGYSDAWLTKGICLAELHRDKDAAEAFQSYLKKNAHGQYADEAGVRLGDALTKVKDYDGAADAYQKVIHEHPNSPLLGAARLGLAWALFYGNKFSDAATLFQDIAEKHAGTEEGDRAAFQAGLCYYQLQDIPKAQEMWKAASTGHDSSAAAATYMLGKSQLDAGKPEDAYSTFESYTKNFANDATDPQRLFYAYAGMGDAAKSQRNYQNAADAYAHAAEGLATSTTKLQVLQNLKYSYAMLGNTEKAKQVDDQIRKEFPNGAPVADQ